MILHLTTATELAAAQSDGVLRPPSLARQGFVHASLGRQWRRPYEALFAGVAGVVLLAVDESATGAEVRLEPGDPGDPAGDVFPHLHGPLPLTAVRAEVPLPEGGAERRVQVPPAASALAREATGPETGRPVAWRRRGHTVTDDPAAFDDDAAWELLRSQYWVGGRDRATFEVSLQGSLVLTLLDPDGGVVGMARVIGDGATFAYLCDVVVAPWARGAGHGRHLVRCALDHPFHAGAHTWFLRTRDAQGVYSPFGFGADRLAARWMRWPA